MVKRNKGIPGRIKACWQTFEKAVRQKKNRKKMTLILLLSLLVITAFIILRFFVSALVNGKPVWRLSIIRALERQGAAQVLDLEISKQLIFQEAKSRGVSVTTSEIEAEIDKIKAGLAEQGLSLEVVLKEQSLTHKELLETIKLQKLVEKLLSDKTQVSDEEVSEYFNDNQELFEEGTKLESIKDEIKDRLAQQKLSQEFQNFTSELRSKANIKTLVDY